MLEPTAHHPKGPEEPANLRLLRILVTTLTATMILGIALVVILLAVRLNAPRSGVFADIDQITLPDHVQATAVTQTETEVLVVGSDGKLYIFPAGSKAPRKIIALE